MVLLVHRLPGIPGYFDAEEALRYAEGMDEDLDVSVRSVSAYSTLGWLNQPWVPDYFSDPVLSTFVKRKDADLAATLIHEMAHQVVYEKRHQFQRILCYLR